MRDLKSPNMMLLKAMLFLGIGLIAAGMLVADTRELRTVILLLLVIWSFAGRYGLGWDAPWYVTWLYALGYAPAVGVVIVLGWAAAAGQLAALVAGRYAPYPSAAERPPRGPFREAVRHVVLAQRRARRAAELERRAANG